MADFKSPGFFEREIEVFPVEDGVRGTPALVVGTANRGKAFVPTTVGNNNQLIQKFGQITESTPGMHGAFRFLENRDALTYVRVLGGGANDTASDTAYTQVSGWAKNAGFRLVEADGSDSSTVLGGGHYYLVADHVVSSDSYPLLTSVAKRHAESLELDDVYTIEIVEYAINVALDAGDSITVTFDLGGTPIPVVLTSSVALDGDDVASLLASEISGVTALGELTVSVDGSIVTVSAAAGTIASITPDSTAGAEDPDVTQTQIGASRTILPILRAQIMCADKYSLRIDDITAPQSTSPDRVTTATADGRNFKLVVLKTESSTTAVVDELIISLEPTDTNYIGRVLNKDYYAFKEKGHVLWREWEISSSVAEVVDSAITLTTGVDESHDILPQDEDGDPQTHLDVMSRYNSRYKNSISPWVVSQPLGASNDVISRVVNGNTEEYNKIRLATRRLFRFHSLSDGSSSPLEVKVSIRNIRASTNPTDLFGTFDVVVRRWDDTDGDQIVLEAFPSVNLNPRSERFIARVIGDSDIIYNWDAANPSERRILSTGRYTNRSSWIRVEVSDEVMNQTLPVEVLPFGYEGVQAPRLAPNTLSNELSDSFLEGVLATVPPVPMRKKVTRGVVNTSQTFYGEAGTSERVDSNLHWGMQWENISTSGVWNAGGSISSLVKTFCMHNGTVESGQLLDGDAASEHLDNEFSLSYVALGVTTLSQVRSTRVRDLILSSYYLRGEEASSIDTNDFRLEDSLNGSMRVTLGTLLSEDVDLFNRLGALCRFTVPLQGGWDGTNPLYRESDKLTDFSSSLEGAAQDGFIEPGFVQNVSGYGFDNNTVYSLRVAAEISTDPIRISANVIATPGFRDPIITDEYLNSVRRWGLALYILDVPAYDDAGLRIFTGDSRRPNVNNTISSWNARNLDNNYGSAYFPDVVAPLPTGRRVKLPATCAALAAIGFSDAESFPWFAPAGFNRGSLDWVEGVSVRLRTPQRDDLYDVARINPIYSGTISDGSFAILGQKTLQLSASALDRVNVRRMVIEAKRILISSMKRLGIFEQNDSETRANFVSDAFPKLNVIRLQQGATSIDLICDESNNSPSDIENGIIRAKCVVVPTRVAEFIAFDFFISSSGDFGFLDS